MFRIFRRIKHRGIRILVIVLCVIFLLVAVVIAFISPIAKYMIEKNSEKYIGRKVEMSWLYINPFTGYVNAHNLRIYENQRPEVFLKTNLSLNVTVRKLFAKSYELTSFTLDELWMNVIQMDSVTYNFSDLMEQDTIEEKVKEAVHYCVKNIRIRDSEIYYNELLIPVRYYITNVNVKCTGIEWDVDTTHVEYEFESGIGSGKVKGLLNFNLKENRYDVKTTVSRFDLKVLEQYMKDFASHGNFSAFLDADIHAKGGLDSTLDIFTTGNIAILDFHLGKDSLDDYISFSRLALNIDSMHPINEKYFFSALVIDTPYIKYERYDGGMDNFSKMFGKGGANIDQAKAEHEDVNIIFLLADYLKELAKNIVNSEYRLDRFDVNTARLVYNDYSLLEKFSATAHPITITAKDMNTNEKRMEMVLKANLNPFGDVHVNFNINPNDFGDFHVDYSLKNLPMPLFNAYTITYSSYPFHRGRIELFGEWNVIDNQINSDNHLIIINPTTMEKVKKQGAKNVPVPLIMAFVRNWDRRIDIEIPITGNLRDPKFNVWDVIFDVIANIFVKPPTFPFRATEQEAKEEKEEFEMLEWKPMQAGLEDDQEEQLRKISRYLFFHPRSHLTISPKNFTDKEKESILLFEAKKKYYMDANNLKSISREDSVTIFQMSIKDSGVIRYLNKHANPTGLVFGTYDQCRILVGSKKIEEEYDQLLAARKKEVEDYFGEKKVKERITIEKGESVVPATGFSHYIFKYSGEVPEEVKKE